MELQNCVKTIRENSSKIVCDFGIRTLRIFGSVSRNEQTENSDLDVCVETQTPNPFLLASLKDFVESIIMKTLSLENTSKIRQSHTWHDYPLSAEVMAMTFDERKDLGDNYKEDYAKYQIKKSL